MANVYNIFKDLQLTGSDLITASVTALLVNSTFVFRSSDQFVSNISSAEVTGAGYSRKLLSNKSVTVSNFTNQSIFTADNIQWPVLDVGSVTACVVYLAGIDDAHSQLIAAFVSFPPVLTAPPATFIVKWNVGGIIRVS